MEVVVSTRWCAKFRVWRCFQTHRRRGCGVKCTQRTSGDENWKSKNGPKIYISGCTHVWGGCHLVIIIGGCGCASFCNTVPVPGTHPVAAAVRTRYRYCCTWWFVLLIIIALRAHTWVCFSHFTFLSTRRHPAQPVFVRRKREGRVHKHSRFIALYNIIHYYTRHQYILSFIIVTGTTSVIIVIFIPIILDTFFLFCYIIITVVILLQQIIIIVLFLLIVIVRMTFSVYLPSVGYTLIHDGTAEVPGMYESFCNKAVAPAWW